MAYFQVFGDRPALYQWDTGRRVIVDCDCQEVHFSNALDGEALVVETYTDDGTKYANIPNILLQAALPLNVYAYVCSSERYTQRAVVLEVNPRSKPADYVYTETEVKNYDALAARIAKLEESGAGVNPEQLQEAVAAALEQAKESGEFEGEPGQPGTTPHIGANGNWYIGDVDTGVKAAGMIEIPGGGGMSATAINLLIEVLESAVYGTNVSGKIASLKEALLAGGSGGGDTGGGDMPDNPVEPDEPVVPDDITVSGGVMTIISVGSEIAVSDGVMTIA